MWKLEALKFDVVLLCGTQCHCWDSGFVCGVVATVGLCVALQ